MTSFTDVVSLGYRCRTTRRIRDHFGVEAAYPFDWWITSAKGAMRFLRTWDVDDLFDPACIAETRAGGASPICASSATA
ncbi:MAG: hypothetical protein WDM92_13485 [Caulobacteraceae bacterium]